MTQQDVDVAYHDSEGDCPDNEEDAGTIYKVAREILDGSMNGYSTVLEDDVDAMSAIGTLCSRFAEVLQDTAKYRDLLTNRGGNAQKLVNILQMLLDYPTLNINLKPGLMKVLLRISTRSSVFPTCLILHGLQFEPEPISDGILSQIWRGTFQMYSVALKVIKIYRDKHLPDLIKSISKEGILWAHLSHPNVVPFYGIFYLHDMEQQICLVSPWMHQGNIVVYLANNPAADRVKLVYEISLGIEYLHKCNVIHGDLKGANVLITDFGSACLCDFGLSFVELDTDIMAYTSVQTVPQCGGTLRYQAPELFSAEDSTTPRVTRECDIYAFACLCYEVFTCRIPYYEISYEPAVLFHVHNGNRPSRPSLEDPSWNIRGLDLNIWGLMEICWDQRPTLRPRAEEVAHSLMAHVAAQGVGDSAEHKPPLLSGATFRRAMHKDALTASGALKEQIVDDEVTTAQPFYQNISYHARSVEHSATLQLWRMRSILSMRTDLSSTFTKTSTYSSIPEGSSDYGRPPSIISTTASTCSSGTFYGGIPQSSPCNVLLSGAPCSGKSTILRQLKIAYGEKPDRLIDTQTVLQCFYESIQMVSNYMFEKNIECSTADGKKSFNKLQALLSYQWLDWRWHPQYKDILSTVAIGFFSDPNVARIVAGDMFTYTTRLLNSSHKHFVEQLPRLQEANYIPSNSDIIHALHLTAAAETETDIKMNNFHMRIYSVYKEWKDIMQFIIHSFESATAVIFCAALDDYVSKYQMEKSIDLFRSVHTSPWFIGKPTILILNKFDVFKDILPKIPITDPQYNGGDNIIKALQFILEKYMNSVRIEPKPVYPHLLQATDLSNVRQMFKTIRDEIIMIVLEEHVNITQLVD